MSGRSRAASWPASLMRGAYAAAGAAVAAVVCARGALAAGEARVRLRERRGHWAGHAAAGQPWIWIHGASLGEAEIALAVAGGLAAECPGARLVVSSMTETGKARVSRDAGVQSRYFPVDFAPFVKRILEPGPPLLFVAVETEIWPATLRVLHRRRVPVAFVNARLSDDSLPRYLRVRPLLAPLLAPVAKVCARDAVSAERWKSLGAMPAAVEVTGNIKFDLAAAPSGPADSSAAARSSATDRAAAARSSPAISSKPGAAPLFERTGSLLLAASTHEGEEALALDAFVRVRTRRPGVRLLVVPRHPERAAVAIALAKERGLPVQAWSDLATATAPSAWPAAADVVVLDRLGLLHAAYRAADAAFVGGSAAPGAGGHNLLEAIAGGCPVASGPHLQNVADQAEVLVQAAALCVVTDAKELSTFWLQVLEDPVSFREPLRAAEAAIAGRRGALERTVRALRPLLAKAVAGGPG